MTKSFTVSFVGLSGVGKTTSLKSLCKDNANLLAEQLREPTEEEIIAWGIKEDTLIPTSAAPNFGKLIFDERGKVKNIQDGVVGNGEVLCYLFDTVGQESFYKLRNETIKGSHGIIFVIDTKMPLIEQKEKLIQLYVEALSHYNDDEVPVVVVCNKQDILAKKSLDKGGSIGFNDGVAGKFKRLLSISLSDFKRFRFYNASAIMDWNVREAVEFLLFELLEKYE